MFSLHILLELKICHQHMRSLRRTELHSLQTSRSLSILKVGLALKAGEAQLSSLVLLQGLRHSIAHLQPGFCCAQSFSFLLAEQESLPSL